MRVAEIDSAPPLTKERPIKKVGVVSKVPPTHRNEETTVKETNIRRKADIKSDTMPGKETNEDYVIHLTRLSKL